MKDVFGWEFKVLAIVIMSFPVLMFMLVLSISFQLSHYYELIASESEIVNATVVNDTGSSLILKDEDGSRIIVGPVSNKSERGVLSEYDRRIRESQIEAYEKSPAFEVGDQVTVEKREDFYSNVKPRCDS